MQQSQRAENFLVNKASDESESNECKNCVDFEISGSTHYHQKKLLKFAQVFIFLATDGPTLKFREPGCPLFRCPHVTNVMLRYSVKVRIAAWPCIAHVRFDHGLLPRSVGGFGLQRCGPDNGAGSGKPDAHSTLEPFNFPKLALVKLVGRTPL